MVQSSSSSHEISAPPHAPSAQVSPSGVARSAAQRARQTAAHVVDAVREGRDAVGHDELPLLQLVDPGQPIAFRGVVVEHPEGVVLFNTGLSEAFNPRSLAALVHRCDILKTL